MNVCFQHFSTYVWALCDVVGERDENVSKPLLLLHRWMLKMSTEDSRQRRILLLLNIPHILALTTSILTYYHRIFVLLCSKFDCCLAKVLRHILFVIRCWLSFLCLLDSSFSLSFIEFHTQKIASSRSIEYITWTKIHCRLLSFVKVHRKSGKSCS